MAKLRDISAAQLERAAWSCCAQEIWLNLGHSSLHVVPETIRDPETGKETRVFSANLGYSVLATNESGGLGFLATPRLDVLDALKQLGWTVVFDKHNQPPQVLPPERVCKACPKLLECSLGALS